MGFTRNNTLIIEDTPSNCSRNYGNAIYINTFDVLSSKLDQDLYRLQRYLKRTVLSSSNVRAFDKRQWLDEILTLEDAEQKAKVKQKSSKAFWMSDTWTHGIKAIAATSIGFTN